MLPFKLVYSEDYFLPIGTHVFPAQKYRLIHERLLKQKIAAPDDFVRPQPAAPIGAKSVAVIFRTSGTTGAAKRVPVTHENLLEMARKMQDWLGLDENSRMNWPTTPEGNWRWRVLAGQLSDALVEEIRKATWIYGRL